MGDSAQGMNYGICMKISHKLTSWEKNISAVCSTGHSLNGQRTPSASRYAEQRTLHLL